MCTVTFIPKPNNQFILTSNRDEAPSRKTLVPTCTKVGNQVILSPKDAAAGGTWIGSSSKQRTLCILNGGDQMHIRSATYGKSRGLVVNELLIADDLDARLVAIDLNDVEPFTLILIDYTSEIRLLELVWNGQKRMIKELPVASRIWSSSSLYSSYMKEKRVRWFEAFIEKNEKSTNDMLEFHWHTQRDNLDYGVIIDRFYVKTTSTTQVEKRDDMIKMTYFDLQNEQSTVEHLKHSAPIE